MRRHRISAVASLLVATLSVAVPSAQALASPELEAQFTKRLAQTGRGDAKALCELGEWCHSQDMGDHVRECYLLAVKAKSDHAPALSALGYKRIKERWVSQREWQRLRGHVMFDGEYVPESRYLRRVSRSLVRESAWKSVRDGMVFDSTHFVVRTDKDAKFARELIRHLELLTYHYYEMFGIWEAAAPEARVDIATATFAGVAKDLSYDFTLPDGRTVNLMIDGTRRINLPDGRRMCVTLADVVLVTDPGDIHTVLVPPVSAADRFVIEL